MMSDNISAGALQPDADERLFDDWFDPIETAVRDRVRCFIEELRELAAVLAPAAMAGERRTAIASQPRWASPVTGTAAGHEC